MMTKQPSTLYVSNTSKIAPAYPLSLLAALLMSLFSLAGLLFPGVLYPSEDLRRSFVSNDVVNLLVGLPVLLVSMGLARRGKQIGWLLWPGALFYITYNYLAYAFARFFSLPFGLYLALAGLSVYAIFRLLSNLDAAAVQERLRGRVPERWGGGVLVGLGALFFLRSLADGASALSGQAALTSPEWAVLIADLLITPVWVVGGVQLWRRRAFGYLSGAGLLFQASMLFVGLLIFFLLQPLLAGVPFPMEDFVVIFSMGLVCFIPCALFIRRARRL